MFLDVRLNIIDRQLQKHNLTDWVVKIVSSIPGFPRAIGLCEYDSNTIYLQYALVALDESGEWLDTLKHEIAHALTPESADHEDDHGPTWQALANVVGCKLESRVKTSNIVTQRLQGVF